MVIVDRPADTATRNPPVSVGERASPLGVGHLLLWIAGCALSLAWLRRAYPASPDWRQIALILFHALGHGAALAGLGMLVLRRFRGRCWLVEPGLSLLSMMGVLALLRIAFSFLPRPLFHDNEVVLSAFTCCLLLLPALARKTPLTWKLAFCAIAMVLTAPLLASVSMALFGLANSPALTAGREVARWRFVICSLILLAASGVELREGTRRTWAHWAGLGDFLWLVALPPAGAEPV